MVTAGGITAGKAYVIISAIDRTKHILATVTRNVHATAMKMQGVGRQIMMGAGLATVGAILPIEQYKEFEDAMLAVRAKMGATSTEYQRLTQLAQHLGETTSYTAQQVAQAMVVMAQMGLKADDVSDSIEGIMAGAYATSTELPAMADYVLTAVRAFGAEFSEATDYADVMTAACNNSALSMEDLGQSLQYASSSGQLAGSSIREVTTLLAALANMGIRGTMAGTSLRRIYEKLALEKEKLQKMGVNPFDDKGNYRPIVQIITDLAGAIRDLPQSEKIAILTDIFEVRGMTGAAKLTQESFTQLATAIENCDGTAARTAAIMDKGVGGAFRLMKSAVERASLAIGEAFRGAIVGSREDVVKLVQTCTEWINTHQQAVVMTTLGIAATAALGAAFVATGLALQVLSIATDGFRLTLTGVIVAYYGLMKVVQVIPMTFGAVTGAIHLTIGAMRSLYVTTKLVYTYTFIACRMMKEGVLKIAGAYRVLAGACHVFLAGIVPAFQAAFGGIKTIVLGTIWAIRVAIVGCVTGFQAAMAVIVPIVTAVCNGIKIAAFLTGNAIYTASITAWLGIQGVLNVARQFFTMTCVAAKIAYLATLAGFRTATTVTTAALGGIYRAFAFVFASISTAMQGAYTAALIGMQMVTTAVTGVIQTVFQAASAVFVSTCIAARTIYTATLIGFQMATASTVAGIRSLMQIAQQVFTVTCAATRLVYFTTLAGMRTASVVTMAAISGLVRAFAVSFTAICGAVRGVYIATLIGFQIATGSTSGIIRNLIVASQHVFAITCAAAKYAYMATMTGIQIATTTTVVAARGLFQIFGQIFASVCAASQTIYTAMLAGLRTATVASMAAMGGVARGFAFIWTSTCGAVQVVYRTMLASFQLVTTATMATIGATVRAFSFVFTATCAAIKAAYLATLTGIQLATVTCSTAIQAITQVTQQVFAALCVAAKIVYAATLVAFQTLTTVTMATIGGILSSFSFIWTAVCTASAAIYHATLTGMLVATLAWCLAVRSVLMGIPLVFGAIKTAIMAIPGLLYSAFTAIPAFLASMTAAHLLAVGLIVGAIALVVAFWPEIMAGLQAVGQGLASIFGSAFQYIINSCAATGQAVWSTLTSAFGATWEGIKTAAVTLWNSLVTDCMSAFGTISAQITEGDWTGAFETAVLAMRAVWSDFQRFFITAWHTTALAFMEIWMTIRRGVQSARETMAKLVGWFMKIGMSKEEKAEFDKALTDVQTADRAQMENGFTASKTRHEKAIADAETSNVSIREQLAAHTTKKDAEIKAKREQRIAEEATEDAQIEAQRLALESPTLAGATVPTVETPTVDAPVIASVASQMRFTAEILQAAQRGTIEAEKHFLENKAERRNALMEQAKNEAKDKNAEATAKHTARLVELAEAKEDDKEEVVY